MFDSDFKSGKCFWIALPFYTLIDSSIDPSSNKCMFSSWCNNFQPRNTYRLLFKDATKQRQRTNVWSWFTCCQWKCYWWADYFTLDSKQQLLDIWCIKSHDDFSFTDYLLSFFRVRCQRFKCLRNTNCCNLLMSHEEWGV